MSSPRNIGAGAPRVRRMAAACAAALVLSLLPAPAISSLGDAEDELKEAKKELAEVRDRVHARLKRIRKVQRRLNSVATRIARTARIIEADRRIDKLEQEISDLEIQLALLKAELDQRNRDAYMMGGVSVMYVLTATSAAEAASRVSSISEMNRRGALLAEKVRQTEDRLARSQADVVRGRQVIELYRRSLERDRREMERAMAESRRLLAGLRDQAERIRYEITRIRPIAVCPIDGPHAIADDFGIVVHHPKDEGGTHVHQGNDMYAAMGTPIVAPFDGTAVDARNTVGGLAVKVYGEFGYVYNAHLSRYGRLGPVEAGDVIGYVGATGNAGGPHDHFEWHPGNGDAVDPHEYLMLVCDAPLMQF